MIAQLVEKLTTNFVTTSKPSASGKPKDHSLLVTIAAVACAVLPFDTFQILVLLLGAVAYLALQSLHGSGKKSSARKNKQLAQVPCLHPTSIKQVGKLTCQTPAAELQGCRASCRAGPQQAARIPRAPPTATPAPSEGKAQPSEQEVRTRSAVPVSAPVFSADAWDGQVQELLGQIAPTPEGNKAVQKLADLVQNLLRQLLPDCEVIGYASSSFTGRQAFAVAVPEVDIVLNANPAALRSRFMSGQRGATACDPWKLQKSALRSCVSHLVASGRFKFRRSAFKSDEPKVTLLAPDSFVTDFGSLEDGIPIGFSINAVTPLYNAALVLECGQVQPRGKDLILLVKRWAKHRGICHAAKGHLPPYAWSILSIYFLQAGMGKTEEPLLPGVEKFESVMGLMADTQVSTTRNKEPLAESEKQNNSNMKPEAREYSGSAGELLKDFFAFYQSFEWQTRLVSVHTGQGSPKARVALSPGGGSVVQARIQDPFNAQRNVAECLGTDAFGRLKEELSRAHALCQSGASLTALLEPWAPPINEAADDKEAQSDNEGQSTKAEAAVAHQKAAAGSSSPPWRKAQEEAAKQRKLR